MLQRINGPGFPRPPHGLTGALLVTLVVAALGAAGLFTVMLLKQGSSPAQERDHALADGSRAIAALNSLDYRNANDGLDRWEAASTGPLRDQIRSSRSSIVTAVQRARSTTSAQVVEHALTGLDLAEGRARLMALVEVTVTAGPGQPVTKRVRLIGDLTRTKGDWKLAGVNVVPVQL